ncbi:MAG: helix-turn-helix transcriptional regulator, partial [Tissierella sp.]|nr:helix-turn-helix transcriptional regulator [Tissierella sp.]
EDIAKVIGVTRPAYTAYERGLRTPDYDILVTLADYFDVSVDYLLGRTDNPNPPNTDFNPLEEINKLLKKYEIDQSGFFDIEKWKVMGPEEIKQLEDYFEFITSKAKKRNENNK